MKSQQQQPKPAEIIAAGQRRYLDRPNNSSTQQYISKTIMNAPFGTSNIQTDYSTFLRPQSKNQPQQQQSQQVVKIPAGAPSWPGLNTFYTPEQISYIQNQGEFQQQYSQQIQSSQPMSIDNYLDLLKKKLISRGFKAGILNFFRQLHRYSHPQTQTITLEQFMEVLNNLRLNETLEEHILKEIFSEGLLDVLRFIQVFAGDMTENRKQAVLFVFKKLDKQQTGSLSLDDIRFNFNPRGHPDTINQVKSEDEILGDFLDTFEQNHALFCNDPKLRNNNVTLEEFINYYTNLALTIPDDNKFISMVIQTWELN